MQNPDASPLAPENRLHYPALDGLRAIALLLVFLQHYVDMPWGYAGVDLFFVLSGFLITGILFDSRDRTDRVRVFYVRRTLRIFPLYYAVLVVLLLITPAAHFGWNRYWLLWPAYLGNFIPLLHPYAHSEALMQAADGQLGIGGSATRMLFLGHFWSLCVEEQFYLVWPWVVFWVKDRVRLLWCCVAVWVVVLVARVCLMAFLPAQYPVEDLLYKATPLRADALLLGGALALLMRGGYKDATLAVSKVVGLVLGIVVAVYWVMHRHSAFPSWQLTWGTSVIDVLCFAVIACALAPGNVVYRVGNVQGLRWLGKISYGLYVFHDIPHRYYFLLAVWLGQRSALVGGHVPQVTALIAFAGTVLLAWMSFRFFETPFLRMKERWAPSKRPEAAVLTAA